MFTWSSARFATATALAASVATVLAAGVEARAATLDLAGAVGQGLERSPVVREAAEKLNQYRHEKNQLRSTLLPDIDLSAISTTRKDSVADKTVGSVPFGGESYNLYTVGVRGEQTLFTYGTFAGVGRGEVQRQIGEKDLEIARRDLTRQVISAFYATVMNENLVRLLENQEKSVRDTLAIAQRRLGLGGKRIDVLQVRTQLALLKPKIQSARNELAASTATLASLIGRSEAGELRIRNHLPALSIQEIEKAVNFKQARIPELQRLRLQRENLDALKTVALGKHLPSVKIVGDYNFINYSKSALFDGASKSWSVQLVLSVPLFSGFSSLPERRSFVAQDAQLEAQERNSSNDIQLQQIRSRKELESAEASLASAEEGAKLARESLIEARREYRVGLIDFLQYFQIERALFEAESSLLQLRYDAIQALSNYFVFSGQPLTDLIGLLSAEGKNS